GNRKREESEKNRRSKNIDRRLAGNEPEPVQDDGKNYELDGEQRDPAAPDRLRRGSLVVPCTHWSCLEPLQKRSAILQADRIRRNSTLGAQGIVMQQYRIRALRRRGTMILRARHVITMVTR